MSVRVAAALMVAVSVPAAMAQYSTAMFDHDTLSRQGWKPSTLKSGDPVSDGRTLTLDPTGEVIDKLE